MTILPVLASGGSSQLHNRKEDKNRIFEWVLPWWRFAKIAKIAKTEIKPRLFGGRIGQLPYVTWE